MTLIAQTFPSLPEIPQSWIVFGTLIVGGIAAIGAAIVAINKLIGAFKDIYAKLHTVANATYAVGKTVNVNPGDNVSPAALESVRLVRDDTTTKATAAISTDPVQPPDSQPKVQT